MNPLYAALQTIKGPLKRTRADSLSTYEDEDSLIAETLALPDAEDLPRLPSKANRVMTGVVGGALDAVLELPAGTTVIVNLMAEKVHRGFDYPKATSSLRIEHVPVADTFVFEDDQRLIDTVEHILELVRNREQVFIHCVGGHGRTGLVAACLLARSQGITDGDAALAAYAAMHATRRDFGLRGVPGKSPQTEVQRQQVRRVVEGRPRTNCLMFYPTDPHVFPYAALSNLFDLRKPPIKQSMQLLPGGLAYGSAEAAFQAQKFPAFPDYMKNIADATTPTGAFFLGTQKSVSRRMATQTVVDQIRESKEGTYPVTVRAGWEEARLEIMEKVIRAKFEIPALRALLLSTADKVLIEHTHRDHYWADGADGSGENHLGRILMKIRDELIREESS